MTPKDLQSLLSRAPWQAYAIALFLTPTLCVMVTRALLAPAPNAESRNDIPNIGNMTMARLNHTRPSQDQLALREAFTREAQNPFGRPAITTKAAQAAAQDTTQSPNAATVAMPTVTLTSIMQTPRGSIAVLSGKMRRAGDRVGAGWILESIDADEGRVVLAHDDGHKHSLSLRAKIATGQDDPAMPGR